MAETVIIRLGGRDFTATRATFGVLRSIGKERNVLDNAFLDPTTKGNFKKFREVPGFYESAYAVIAAHLQPVAGDDGKEIQPKISPGEVAAVCDSATDEMAIQADIFNALTAIQKLDYPQSLEKKAPTPDPE